MTIESLKKSIMEVIRQYPVSRVVLFGSRADGTNRSDSDIDLIVEFHSPITLITLSGLKIDLEEALNLKVDIIHGPIQEGDMLEIGEEVVLYAA
ncbi:MAG: nucleotidyltransferase domain-containing protein [Bacillota bacterium]|nr:nucleotidyltransferase domain-containing protein [Bacillota bacterium]